jgi:hypothetical protein
VLDQVMNAVSGYGFTKWAVLRKNGVPFFVTRTIRP